MKEFKHITSDSAVNIYEATEGVFMALLNEVRELSKKKPDAILSLSKVNLLNRVLGDLLDILRGEPEGKYLKILESDDLPQASDALLMMAQFDAALKSFKGRYYQYISTGTYTGENRWVTSENLDELMRLKR